MSPSQLARRDRVLRAVIELAPADDVDDLAMRDVAERSGVALGTIYRYFSGKEHLCAAALEAWARSLDGTGAPGGGGATTMSDRLVAILRQAVRAYERRPACARLLIVAATSTDPCAGACYRALGDHVYATLGTALDGLTPEEQRRVLDVVGAVWYHALVEWVHDRKTIAQVHVVVEDAARLVMAGFEARAATGRGGLAGHAAPVAPPR